jgi:transcriptional regulator with XRE-family HTH domain
MLQSKAAAQLGVTAETLLLWEKDRAAPTVRSYPAIFRFLGYRPGRDPTTLAERIKAKRKELGLPLKEAAKLIGVDEGTFSRWESGEWRPRLSRDKVARFLAITDQLPPF